MKHRQFIFWGTVTASLLLLTTLSVITFYLSRSEPGQLKQPKQHSQVTLEGAVVCLPHKDTSGPQTMECAQGLKVGNVYYALQSAPPDLHGGNVRVTGMYELPDERSIYQTVGTIKVTKTEPKP